MQQPIHGIGIVTALNQATTLQRNSCSPTLLSALTVQANSNVVLLKPNKQPKLTTLIVATAQIQQCLNVIVALTTNLALAKT